VNHSIGMLVGLTLAAIERDGDETLTFVSDHGRRFRLWHSQDCCENVRLAEVVGDLNDLIGSPILTAEERVCPNGDPPPEYPESWTWTFYELATNKGSVTLRWLGESNGYYSEGVDFAEVGA
jgi:hypothetical protein